MAVSGNGRWLILAGGDVTNKSALLQLIDLTTQSDVGDVPSVRRLSGHTDIVLAAAFSPDSQWLLTGSLDGTCRLWPLKDPTGMESYELSGHRDMVLNVAFSPDGLWAGSASRDKSACLWRLSDQPILEPAFVLRGHASGVSRITISADSHYCVTTGFENQARVWDLTAADPSAQSVALKGHEAAIRDVAIDTQNRWIATVGDDATPRLWRLPVAREPSCDRVLRVGDAPVFCADLNREGRRLVSGSRDGAVRIWELAAPEVSAPRELPQLGVPVTSIIVSPDGRRVAAAGRLGSAGEVSVWDIDANPPRLLLNWRGQQRLPIAADPGVNWLLAGSSFNLSFWDLREAINPNPARTELLTNEVYVFSVAIDRERRWLAAAGTRDMSARADGEIALWRCSEDGPSGGPLWLKGHQGLIYALTFTPDGRWLASGSFDRSVRLWNLAVEHPDSSPLILPTREWVYDLAVSNDGRWLVTDERGGTSSGIACVWDLRAANVARSRQILTLGNSRIVGMAISPDNGRLALAGSDETLRVFSLRAADMVGSAVELHDHSGGLTSVRFTPDSRQLVATSLDGTTRIWELDLRRLESWVTIHAGRELTLEERREESLLPAEFAEAERLRQSAERDIEVGSAQGAVGHLRDVIALYERVSPASPTVRLYRNHLAEAYDRLATLLATAVDPAVRNLPEAVALSTKAVASSPDRDDFWQTLARAQLEMGNLDEATAAVERALELRPDACDHLFLSAIIQFRRGDRERSWRDYEQAVTWVPPSERYLEPARKLGLLAQETLVHPLAPDALEASRKAITEGEDHELRLEYDQAQDAYRRALTVREALYQVAPDRMRSRLAEALNLVAWSIVATRNAAAEQLPQALELARRAVQLAPNSWASRNTLGLVQYRVGDWRNAIGTITRAQPLETYHQDTAYDAFVLAMAHHRLNESDKALEQLNIGRQVIERLQAGDPNDRYLPALMAFSEEAAEVVGAVVGEDKS